MTIKQIFILIGVVLLYQGSYAAPYQDMDSAILALKERLILTKIFATEYNSVSEKVLENGKTVFENVLKDPKVLEVKTESMKRNLNELQNFIEKYEKFDNHDDPTMGKYKSLQQTFNNVANKYEDDFLPLVTDEEKIIQQSMKENGLLKIIFIVEPLLEMAMEKFRTEVENYLNGLNEIQKRDESELFDWLESYKNEKDKHKRADLLKRFVERVDFEKFIW